MWRQWADELPLWEASFELDPPETERIDNAAWQISRAARTKATIYESEFDGRERRSQTPQQSPEEMIAEAAKIEQSWPHNKGVKSEKGVKGKP